MSIPAHLRAVLAPKYSRLDPAGRVDEDIPCDNCRYNVRTLQPAALCPECGTPIIDSLYWRCEKRQKSAWLLRLSWGALVGAIASLWAFILCFNVIYSQTGLVNSGTFISLNTVLFAGILCTGAPPHRRETTLETVIRLAVRWLTIALHAFIITAIIGGIQMPRVRLGVCVLLPLYCTLVAIHLPATIHNTPWKPLRICTYLMLLPLVAIDLLCAHFVLTQIRILPEVNHWWIDLFRPLVAASALFAFTLAIWYAVRCHLEATKLRRTL